eukprot:TRINITY_DN5138_c0_g2_i2.p1 TRINITY_DN5138_c0_g2~~TRINITY_DN5138_c0_g2_i2.p1  ORF type:complete len:289 (-),score=62.96 TRINITY_DN5138_c0_g2_i2:29-829(-)
MSVSTVYDDVVASVFEPDDSELAGSGMTLAGKRASTLVGTNARAGDAKKLKPSCEKPVSEEERMSELRRQLEHYMSDGNLEQDPFFHEKICADPGGWVDACWFLECPKVVGMGIKSSDPIETALSSSEALETRRVLGTVESSDGDNAASSPSGHLQLRRRGGREPPLLYGGRPKGWLAAEVAERRRATAAAEGDDGACRGGSAPAAPIAIAAGARVRVRATGGAGGEHAGKCGQVLSVDGGDVTVLVDADMDIITLAAASLEQETA